MNSIIETERLLLRQFTLDDVEAVYSFNADLEVHRYTGDVVVVSLQQAKDIITKIWFKDYQKYGYGRWALVYKPEWKVIGFAGLKYLPELNETDIGYRMLPQYWGKGLATEASNAIIRYGFEKLQLDRIIGLVDAQNIGSWKVLQRIGMKHYQTKSYLDSPKDYDWYKLEKEDYFQ